VAVRKLRVLTDAEAGKRETAYKPQGLIPVITGPDGDEGDTWVCGRCGHTIMQAMGPKAERFTNSTAECAVCHTWNDIDLKGQMH
jgi:hypothetical protein